MISVVLCDDHAVVRAGLRALLDSADDFEVTGEAGSGEEAVAVATATRPDVVLMDLQFAGGIDGVEATRQIVALADAPHVLVLTTYDTDADIGRAIEAGATGYLLKAGRPEELFAAIRGASRGESVLSPPIAQRMIARMRTPAPSLTDRELDVLRLVAEGLSNREIASRLFVSETTVKTHLAHLYEKLGVDTRTAAVTVATERRLIGF